MPKTSLSFASRANIESRSHRFVSSDWSKTDRLRNPREGRPTSNVAINSPRELAVRFTNKRRYFVSEVTVYRLLKAHDLITSPAYLVIKAADQFHTQTTRINEMWQTENAAERMCSRRTLHLFQDHRMGLDVSVDRARPPLALHYRLNVVYHPAGRGRD